MTEVSAPLLISAAIVLYIALLPMAGKIKRARKVRRIHRLYRNVTIKEML